MPDAFYFLLLGFLPVLLAVCPRSYCAVAAVVMITLQTLVSSLWAIQSLEGGLTLTMNAGWHFWGVPVELSVDPLSAFFILVINLTMLTGAVYALGYSRAYGYKSRGEFALHFISFVLLHFAMLLVTLLQNGLLFLFAWELMSVSSFFLVIFEGERSNTLSAGFNYLIQMHIAAFLLLVGFVLLEAETGSMTFAALSVYFANPQPIWLFLVFFAAFSIKAGFIPFHTWLPHAHPAAPSYVSGVMSGVMIKMGVYGLARVLLHTRSNALTIGLIVLGTAAVSGVSGVMVAIIQHDLKRLLAYSSIENIGIIGIGLGIGMIGVGLNHPWMAFLGFSGGLLHVLNHSLFKSLLFYGAGTVYQQCHTRNIEKLGGLIKSMPQTAILFLIGSLAICGLPPFNGFVSEFLIFSALLDGVKTMDPFWGVVALAGLLALAIIGGLAIYCFTKAFGLVFLGTPRSHQEQEPHEAPLSMRLPQYLIALLIVGIGLAPWTTLSLLKPVVLQFVPFSVEATSSSVDTLRNVGLGAFVLIALSVALYLIRTGVLRDRTVAYGPTWGCGYTGSTGRMQYTATSYTESYTHLVKPALNLSVKYDPIAPADLFPRTRPFSTHSEDLIEAKGFLRIVQLLTTLIDRAARLQTGQMRHYVLYAFVFLLILFVLTFLRWI